MKAKWKQIARNLIKSIQFRIFPQKHVVHCFNNLLNIDAKTLTGNCWNNCIFKGILHAKKVEEKKTYLNQRAIQSEPIQLNAHSDSRCES